MVLLISLIVTGFCFFRMQARKPPMKLPPVILFKVFWMDTMEQVLSVCLVLLLCILLSMLYVYIHSYDIWTNWCWQDLHNGIPLKMKSLILDYDYNLPICFLPCLDIHFFIIIFCCCLSLFVSLLV